MSGHRDPGAARLKTNQDQYSAPTRMIARGLAYVIGRPLVWAIERLGFSDRVWGRIGQKIRNDVAAKYDFGDYRPTASDVIVCTFPKCGTNWAMQIAHQVATRGAGEFDHIHDVVPWPDFSVQEAVLPLADTSVLTASPTGLRVIKTHLEWDRIPHSDEARYLCVVRDPKDAFVSGYHFIREVLFGPLMPSVPVWLRLTCSTSAPFIWSEHLHGYWKERHRPNVMVITFEEMKADLSDAVGRIAAFMDVKLSESEFKTVCEKSSFTYMKSIGERFEPPAITPFSSAKRVLIRSGVSGGSSELLNPTQQAMLDDHFRADLERLGSDFPFDVAWRSPS